MTQRIAASSEPITANSHFYIETRVDDHWHTMDGIYADLGSAVAFAKAYGGSAWNVIEVIWGEQ